MLVGVPTTLSSPLIAVLSAATQTLLSVMGTPLLTVVLTTLPVVPGRQSVVASATRHCQIMHLLLVDIEIRLSLKSSNLNPSTHHGRLVSCLPPPEECLP